MENIKQNLKKIYENGKDYSKSNDGTRSLGYSNNIIEHENIIDYLLKNKFSIITGSNGVGKTYLLNNIYNELNNRKEKCLLINLKEYNNIKYF